MTVTDKPEAEPPAKSVLTPVPPTGGSFVWDEALGCPVPAQAPPAPVAEEVAAPAPAPEPVKGRAK